MRFYSRILATAELVLVFPAVLFMIALFVRSIQPIQREPAHTAQRIVDWYAARPHVGLWGLLIALPLTVLVTGSGMLVASWNSKSDLRNAARLTLSELRTHLATVSVAGATLLAGGILMIVALHVLTN